MENTFKIVFKAFKTRFLKQLEAATYVKLEGSPDEVDVRVIVAASYIEYFIGIIIISIEIVHDTVFQVDNEWDSSRTIEKNVTESLKLRCTINTVRAVNIYFHFVTHVATRGYPH